MKNNTVSTIQKYIWLDQQLAPDSPKYNTGGYAIINGTIEFDKFEQAILKFTKSQSILNYVFQDVNGVPGYQIKSDSYVQLLCFEEKDINEAIGLIKNDFKIPFDLSLDERLFKMWLIKIDKNKYIWYTKLHHLIADGFSFQLLFNEVNDIYSSNKNIDEEQNLDLYQIHIDEEQKYLTSERFTGDKNFWINKYDEFPSLIFNKEERTQNYFNKEFNLSTSDYKKLKKLAAEENVSVFHVLIASISLVLSNFYFTNEINLGLPILNRTNKREKQTLGPFINLMPLQLKFDVEDNFSSILKQIKKALFGAFRHQKFQQADLIKELSYEQNRLYDIRISYENFDYQNKFAGHPTSITALSNDSEDDPISVHIMNYNEENLKFRFDVNEAFVSKPAIKQLIHSIQNVFRNIDSIVDKELNDIEITNEIQREAVLAISKGEEKNYPQKTFLDLWGKTVQAYENNTAVTFRQSSNTYKDVDKKAKQIVHFLNEKGVRKGDAVGLLLSRSENTIPAILGILMSGATYVPLDKNFPEDRINYITQDSALKGIIVDEDNSLSVEKFHLNEILGKTIFKQGNLLDVEINPDDIAYIIYTSGSTGKPKGVLITHESLIDYSNTFQSYFKVNENDRVLQQSSFTFDTSIEEIFPVLGTGGTLIISEDPKDFHQLALECQNYKVTLLSTNPYVVQYLNSNIDKYDLSLKTLISGGDVLKRTYTDKLISQFDVYNTYGPTESTVCATYHKVNNNDVAIPIGKPIFNRDVYILNNNKLLPKGATGEICLSGKGLAKAYLNNPELTSKLFVQINGERLYKTGDLGKWDTKGNLVFLGRKDNQLSYRGYRIEAEEIEYVIKEINQDIKNCVVILKNVHQTTSLIAYIKGDKARINSTNLSESIRKKFPSYMIPDHFVILEDFPLLTSGKINQKKLPIPKQSNSSKKTTLPSSSQEKQIAKIWTQLLGIEILDTHTSFFELGGHSLLANQFIAIVREELNQEIPLKSFYENPTIHDLANILKNKTKKIDLQLKKAPEQELYPLSFPQERLWFLNQLNEDNRAYYVPRAIKMIGSLDVSLLEQTFTLLIEKHEILRTVFPTINGEPFQKILDPYYFEIPVIALENFNKKEQERKIADFILNEGNLLFDLEKGPLLRITLLKKSVDEHILVFCEHHLIHDGWTQGILLREFIDIYTELTKNPSHKIEKPKLQFKDFSYWQKTYFTDNVLDSHIDFWKSNLQGHTSVLSLPQKNKRPKEITGNGALLARTLDNSLADQLREYSVNNNATLFITMLSAFKMVLSRYSNETDICIGTTVANRRFKALDNMLGMVINTIALRTQLSNSDSIQDVFNKVKETCFETYSYEDSPFGKVVEHVSPQRDLGLMPLFQYLFSFMNTPSRNLYLPNLQLEILDSHNLSAKFDLNIVVVTPLEQADQEGIESTDRRIIIEWEYNSDIYAKETMEQMFDAYFKTLKTLVSEPALPYLEIPLIDEKERKQLLQDFNNTQVDYPKDKTIVELFKEQVLAKSGSIALVYKDKELTFQEVDTMSNAMANYLLEHHFILPEQLIGVKLERSEWLIISLLAILKTGAAYVPIDPNYPQQRIEYIIEDSQCKLIIDEEFIEQFKRADTNVHSPNKVIDSRQLAYVIYTSGSTGRPKGVMIEHKSVTLFISNFLAQFKMNSISNVALTTNCTFDISVLELLGSLCIGKKLILFGEDQLSDPIKFIDYIFNYEVDFLQLTPSRLHQIVQINSTFPKCLRVMLVGGEALPQALKDQVLSKNDHFTFINVYGPTETTIWSTFNYELKGHKTTIGKPLNNEQIYIVSDQQKLQPLGTIGELCISGESLARGYLNRIELTQEKFINHPFKEGERLYRTGDLARWLPDGNIEFIGRIDNQVKLRGYRIELGEIENVLLKDEAIEQAVVEVKTLKAEKYLVAYYISNEKIDNEELKQLLRDYLPEYMIPNYYFKLDEIPLTPSGKVDRKALPNLQDSDLNQREYVAPRNETELKLASVWQEVLSVEKVGINDNFFELGGHSLKVTQLINKINKELLSTVKVKEVFNFPTIESLVKKIQSQNHNAIPEAPKQSCYPLTSSQKRLWVLSQFEGGNKAYNIPGVFELKGKLQKDKLEQAFQYIIARHNSLRTCFIEQEDEVVQKVVPNEHINFLIEVIDKVNNTNKLVQSFYEEEFDLRKAPLVKAKLLHVNKDHHLLLFAIHHIIGDGWSMEVFTKELTFIYNQLLQKKPIELPQLHIQYEDYVMWQQREEAQSYLKKQETYWLTKLGGELPGLELPSYKSRPLVKSYNGDTLLYRFSKELSDSLNSYSQAKKVTLYMTLLAGINALFYRYTDSTDIVLGTPIAGRTHPDLENQIGLYLNTLTIRTEFSPANSFEELVNIQKTTLLECYEHQDYPFDELVDKLNVKRDTSRSALFDVMVVLQNQQSTNKNIGLDGLDVILYNEQSNKVSHFDITFSFAEDEQGIKLRLEYNTDIYDHGFVSKLVIHLESFLKQALSSPKKKISLIDYLSEKEKYQLLIDFNDTKADYPKNKTVIDIFKEQVQKTPTSMALVYEDRELTYREVDIMSNAMANYLLEHHLILPEQLIGVQLERSEWLIISLLAILKTGAAYVPIDPSYPKQRIEYIIEDSQCQLIIDEKFIEQFRAAKTEGQSPNVVIDPQQLAYVIYTSGSTGKPKGVMIEHRSVVRLVKPCNYFTLNNDTILLSTGSISFDATTIEFYGTLLNGGRLVLLNQDKLLSTEQLKKGILDYEINTMWITSSWFNGITEEDITALNTITHLAVGGDIVSPLHIEKFLSTQDNRYVINGYGPTENTTFSTTYKITKNNYVNSIPIGKPIENSQAYVLSPKNQLLPKGVIGELCVSGDGLARGYLNRSELTKEKFIDHPFKEGERLYKTGDLARWLPDGNIEFIGRIDSQVKLRGYRIELGEIENVLLKEMDIGQAVVEIKNDNQEKYLVAYYTSNKEKVKEELRQLLQSHLPEYMIPNYFIRLDEIPLTHNGKVDRKALPNIEDLKIKINEYVAPRNEIELKLTTIWQKVLGVEKVGINDNFFELGGHSLKAVSIRNQINKIFDIDIQIKTFFNTPTISNIAEVIIFIQSQSNSDICSQENLEEIVL